MKEKLISLVVPMYCENEVARECYKRLKKVMQENNISHEILFVNDGSKDNTLNILEEIAAEDKKVKVISFARNFGHQIAVTAGIKKATGDAVVVIDADLQDPPELIPDMLKLWQQGYHVVYGQRKKRRGETWFKLTTAKYFYRFLNKMTEVDIPVDTGDFRLMDRRVVDVFNSMPEKNRFIRGMISWIGFKQTALMYEREERFAGETKYPLKKMLKLASDGILSFSFKPIKWIEGTGLVVILLGILLMLYSGISWVRGTVSSIPGWLWLMVLLSGIHLFALGIIGEYLVRIYDEARRRPLYTVEKEINIE
ncbi:glycosyltransferase family 2 protein [Clostridium formicaceticum]|uniref:Glycosyltransferase n=1 Tax=Clostridium formicaceticum TaxID=1497 RepID=A0AAC9WEK4_9CLOT|nr:glycosyltransferase family 2 protein [Clostridium formicaceticum]AOY75546.1 glycosyltransferase [Clostridium formicaceticum]ARE85842.1 Putative glycosyltransferase CsbB [Clostridium formicaceticum]